ncbi:MAG TPA: hypothetical protein DCY02_05895 [Armatimonadetes bacterium]|nr:hypothetical protein [Armatimonadota bacterium]
MNFKGWNRHLLWLVAAAPFVSQTWLQAAPTPIVAAREEIPTFEKDVLPILKGHCTACHNPDTSSAFLDLTTYETTMEGGQADNNVVAGDPEASNLMRRILGHGGKPQMPLGFAPLSPEKTETIRAWIKAGAKPTPEGVDLRHWAYVPPQKPSVPEGAHPIDYFVGKKLAEQGHSFSPEASRTTLIRRLSLDLTGLPPTPEEVDAFLADTRPDAYERVVDRLLASPQYGERLARMWLDLARYADSNGYEKDLGRQNWAWRDYVIKSFNADKPFDQFTTEQIAGDLLDAPTREQLIATGFHRNTSLNEEGGTDPQEQRWQVLVDRAAVTGTVWMASSTGCAQCHDHKFDPISQKDFYETLAFWESADEPLLALTPEEVSPYVERIKKREEFLLSSPESDARKAALEKIKKERESLEKATTLVLQESKERKPETPIREGGVYLAPGEVVPAGVPENLAPWQPEMPLNRLGLAQWLTHRDNPLTARVTVNRIWELIFGLGIVKTPGDFGTQSEAPSHPELLDYLAVDFRDQGWSLKKLIRTIVTSRTYRQSSAVTDAMRAWDPDNRYLGRAPRYRMEAEMIRDNALFVSGLLDLSMGGPSVFPPQPEGIWDNPYSGDQWITDPTKDKNRRGLYTFWKRTAPYPSFLTFDATSREACTDVRVRTNTPLQALVLMNDPVYLEAAAALSARMDGEKPEDRIQEGFRLVLARTPSKEELEVLKNYQALQAKVFAAAQREDAEEASWRMLASLLLNLDEAITRE